ncbi:MAG TPA: hypothetical protein VLX59_15590 [Acidimicrobiales bacterium]|nr:hypothetical protein [Acidimicrobiales bacterium]
MRLLARVASDDVVAAFLQAEINSPRFGEQLGEAVRRLEAPGGLISAPDTSDHQQNLLRLALFHAYRGVRPLSGLFDGFPDDMTWYRAVLGGRELSGVLYINWDYWLEVSAGSRRPAAALVKLGEDRGVRAVAAEIGQGRMPTPIIIVGDPEFSRLVVLEGHIRLTAMVLAYEHLPAEVDVLLGTSPSIGTWPLF